MVKTLFQNKNILALLILGAVILSIFHKLTQTFYQQDEWNFLGLVFAEGLNVVIPGSFRLIDLLFVKGRFLSNLIFYFFVTQFPFENSQIAILAIVLHIVASFVVYKLIYSNLKSFSVALIGAIFFAVNSVAHGAVTWSFVAFSAVTSTILILLAVIVFFKFVETLQKKWLLLVCLLLYISLWFKETGLSLFVFFPLAILLFKRFSLIEYLKQFWIFFVPFVGIVSYRILDLRLRTTDSDLYLTGASDNFFLTILIRSVLYPLTSFSLMFIPGEHAIEAAREVLRDNYSFFAHYGNNLLISQSVILDLIAVILTGAIFVGLFLLLYKEKKEQVKYVVFWLLFTLLSFMPYVLLDKDFAYLESRYYYLPVTGAAFFVAWVIKRIRDWGGKFAFVFLALPLSMALIIVHALNVKSAIAMQLEFSSIRKDFIDQLYALVPILNDNSNIIFIDSDRQYWADGNRVPFQQGTGYTLMTLFYGSGKIPKKLLSEGYLFPIGSQGYRVVDGKGFGFFWDRAELERSLGIEGNSQARIIELKYFSAERKLERLK